MDLSERKQWNENHKKLTQMILDSVKHQSAVDLFLQQHRLLHSSRMRFKSFTQVSDFSFCHFISGMNIINVEFLVPLA